MEPERETGQVRGAETGSILPVPDLPRCHPKIGGFNGYCQLKKPNFIVSSINVQIWLFIYHTWLPLFVSHLSLHPSPESGFHFPRQKKKNLPHLNLNPNIPQTWELYTQKRWRTKNLFLYVPSCILKRRWRNPVGGSRLVGKSEVAVADARRCTCSGGGGTPLCRFSPYPDLVCHSMKTQGVTKIWRNPKKVPFLYPYFWKIRHTVEIRPNPKKRVFYRIFPKNTHMSVLCTYCMYMHVN